MAEEELSETLLRDCLREVASSYDNFNWGLFQGKLRRPLLEWSVSHGTLGSWSRQGRTLRLSLQLLEQPWGVFMEVLKHEMAHQYVDECLGERDESAHGPLFRRVCSERGIDPRAAGLPTQGDHVETERVVQRIQKLFALAGSDNRNEAEVAMATARRLMLKHNLGRLEQGPTSNYSFTHLGRPTGRRMAWQRVLANLLADHFFVEIIIVPAYRPAQGKRGSVLEACGTPANLEIASYVHEFLERAAQGAWTAHKKRTGLRVDKDRQSYLYGVMCGFRDKLEREENLCKQQGLVWLGDAELGAYFRRRHPHVRSVSGRSRVDRDAFSAGHEAGSRLVIHRGVGDGAGATGYSSSPRRLLPGQRSG